MTYNVFHFYKVQKSIKIYNALLRIQVGILLICSYGHDGGKTGRKGFITRWETVSKSVCRKARCPGAAGDKGSGLRKGVNWWVSLRPIFNFTRIWKVKGSELVSEKVTGWKYIEGNHSAVSLGGEGGSRQRPLTASSTGRSPSF